MWSRMQLKMNGKQLFYKNYWECVAVALIMGFFSGVPNFAAVKKNLETQRASLSEFGLYGSSVDMSELYQSLTMAISLFTVFGLLITAVFVLLKLLVGNALMVGGNLFFIENRNGGRGFGIAASSFRSGRYGNIVLTMFLMDLFISLWSLLLIIPGIIKSYEYLMVPYILAENPQMDRAAVVYSGDPGFYSGAGAMAKLLEQYEEEYETVVIPGISTVSCLCARLKTGWEDVFPASLHGREQDVEEILKTHRRVFLLMGGKDPLKDLCRRLTDQGRGNLRMAVGIRLSYPEERILTGTVKELEDQKAEGLCAVLLERDK